MENLMANSRHQKLIYPLLAPADQVSTACFLHSMTAMKVQGHQGRQAAQKWRTIALSHRTLEENQWAQAHHLNSRRSPMVVINRLRHKQG